MKYRKVGENKYRKCAGILTETVLILLIFAGFILLGAVL